MWKSMMIGVVLVGTGCSSSAPSSAPSGSAADAGSSAAAATYPAGPYGSDVGSTITNFSFPSLSPPDFAAGKAGTTKLGDFYDPTGAAGHKLLVVNMCSVWCLPCKDEFASLASKAGAYASKGVSIVSVLFENGQVKPISIDEASAYATERAATFPVAIDPQYQLTGLVRPVEIPAYVVVSARDMKVLGTIKVPSEVWSFVDQKLAEIH